MLRIFTVLLSHHQMVLDIDTLLLKHISLGSLVNSVGQCDILKMVVVVVLIIIIIMIIIHYTLKVINGLRWEWGVIDVYASNRNVLCVRFYWSRWNVENNLCLKNKRFSVMGHSTLVQCTTQHAGLVQWFWVEMQINVHISNLSGDTSEVCVMWQEGTGSAWSWTGVYWNSLLST